MYGEHSHLLIDQHASRESEEQATVEKQSLREGILDQLSEST